MRLKRSAAFALLLVSPAARGESPPALRGSEKSIEQVLVFDAGSSGTRIHVFNLSPSSGHVPRIDLSVRDVQTKKVKPGLSHYATNKDPQHAGESVKDLLEFAKKFVAEERRARTPALLKATAGLRSVGEEEAAAVLQQVRVVLSTSGFMFRDEWADIIKGKEEAGLSWVAANYLRGTFDELAEGSLGVIEMGGGSTQVAFQVDSADVVAPDDKFVFTTSLGRKYHVYAHSYLGFGQDHAQAHLRERLQAITAKDPCYPVGYRRKAGAAIVEGSGDRQSCEEYIKAKLFDASETAPGRYSSELSLRGRFVCTENFFYVRMSLGLPLESGVSSMDAQAGDVCARSIELTAEKAAAVEAGTADAGEPNSCFGLSYQVVLLQALGVPTTPGVQMQIQRQINNADVDWALGAALVHSLVTFPSPRMPESSPDSWLRYFLVFLGMVAMIPMVRAVLGPVFCKNVEQSLPTSKVAATIFGNGAKRDKSKGDIGPRE